MEILDKLAGVPFKPKPEGSPEFTVDDQFKDLAKESREKQRVEPDQTISQKFTNMLNTERSYTQTLKNLNKNLMCFKIQICQLFHLARLTTKT